MFILEARSARIELGERDRLRTVARVLHDGDYRALTESMLSAAERAASLPEGSLDTEWLAPQPRSAVSRPLPEMFFGATSAYVLVPAGKRLDAWEVRLQDQPSSLDSFCAAVTTALREGGVADDAELPSWRPRTPQVPRDEAADDASVPVSQVSSHAQRRAARVLASDEARGFIAELVRSGSTITDLDDSPVAQYSTLGDLHRNGLIEREYVIVCRQDHRTLGRLGDLDDTARQSILQLSCPTCGRRFSEELLRQVHAPSRAAMALLENGSWRATWILDLLEERGLDLGQMTYLAGAGGNGSALRIATAHGRLLVEMPEVEFGMQHAYALIRRLQRQNVGFGLVLSTEPVSDDAYQYLSDRVVLDQGPMVSVLEGADAISRELSEALAEWSIISVRMLAEELIDTVGIDLGAVLESWMRRDRGDEAHDRAVPVEAHRDEHTASYRYRSRGRTHDDTGDVDVRTSSAADTRTSPSTTDERGGTSTAGAGSPSSDADLDDRSAERDSDAATDDDATVTELPRVASSGQSS